MDKDAKEYEDLKKFKEEVESGKHPTLNPVKETEDSKNSPEVIFNTHKFIYTLFHEGKIQGHIIEYEDRDGNIVKGKIDSIEIGASPVSARFHFVEGGKKSIPFIRIKKVFFQGQLVWDDSDNNTSNVKVIKGF